MPIKYHITKYTLNKAKKMGVFVKPSLNKAKKIDVFKKYKNTNKINTNKINTNKINTNKNKTNKNKTNKNKTNKNKTNKNKTNKNTNKYKIIKIGTVGALGMNDYPTYKIKRGLNYANSRRRLYKKRHEKDRHIKWSNGWLADKLLW